MKKRTAQGRRGKNCGKKEVASFRRNTYKFPTEKITGAQHFIFAPKFPQQKRQNGKFSATKLVFVEADFPTKTKCSYTLKCLGRAIPPALPP